LCLSSVSNCLAVFTSYLSFYMYFCHFTGWSFQAHLFIFCLGLSVGMFAFCKSVYVLVCLSFPFCHFVCFDFCVQQLTLGLAYFCLLLCLFVSLYISFVCLFVSLYISFICLFVSFIYCWFVPICVIGSLTMGMEKLARTVDTMKNKINFYGLDLSVETLRPKVQI